MAEQPSHISREAKGLQQGLKEALRSQDPWDRDIEFQRKNLRRHHLRLLLVHPYAKESKDVENHLWMQTSYAFISIYKHRIASLDRALQSAPRHQPRQGGHGPVEYRKLMQRFRQFLAEEEKFWTQLVVRLRRSFGLDEAQSAFVVLGILSADEPISAQGQDSPEQLQHREGPTTNGRNQFQFPPEEGSPSVLPQFSTERAGRLAILSKALVCLGDIARYRELYNESGGRPKAGHEESPVPARKNARNKRGGAPGTDPIPRARNYDKAQHCYEQARLLVPCEGNPSHQLAILASYQKDLFGSLIHYYRALCVLQPYDTALENLGIVVNKALDQWKARMARVKEKNANKAERDGLAPLAPRLRVEIFKEKVVVLHALWRLGLDEMEAISPKHAGDVLIDFNSLVAERVLPIDTISKVLVLAQGALWKHHNIRDSTSPLSISSSIAIESHIAAHILGLHKILLEVGLVQLAESPPQDAAENDLAQRITATFRRMLPALRIAGKWLRANFKYVLQGQQSVATKTREDAVSNKKEKRKSGPGLAIAGAPLFWESYAQFISALYRSFPEGSLPALTSPLEEDVDMKGFLPLKNLMAGEERGDKENKGDRNTAAAQVHPNEEQLMRIADLLNDAKILIDFENSPLVLRNPRSGPAAGGSLVQPARVLYIGDEGKGDAMQEDAPSVTKDGQSDIGDREDDAMTETDRTDDDPVGDAFRQALDGSDGDTDDQDDKIVWDPRASMSPIRPAVPTALPSPPRVVPMSPIAPSFTPRSPALLPPTRPQAMSPLAAQPALSTAPTSTTAQDLLNSFMGPSRDTNGGDLLSGLAQESSAPQPPLLFGSGPPNRPGHSIWSMSLDDSSLNFPNTNGSAQHTRPYVSPTQSFSRSPQHSSQPSWPSSFVDSSQSSPSHLMAGALPSSFSPRSHYINNSGSHKRTPSATFFSSQSPRSDSFAFSSAPPPQPYHSHTSASHLPAAYVDPSIMAASSSLYPEASLPDYRSSSLHHHDSRVGQAFAPVPVPQLWGNNG